MEKKWKKEKKLGCIVEEPKNRYFYALFKNIISFGVYLESNEGVLGCSNQLTPKKSGKKGYLLTKMFFLSDVKVYSKKKIKKFYNLVSMVLVPYGINPNFDIVPRVMVTSLRSFSSSPLEKSDNKFAIT
ncbi:hypothetical protein BpHYR1_017139 [Brachionus plicatilis]|uniref:Uncharacterized protein n=1 Tax=Brachionus plicatilis TaxID=10195 RepID=A0A3M7S5N1_BRAPC|nr:hypothetical protein BpHYR1_017139 [Brachionus plicatilis]